MGLGYLRNMFKGTRRLIKNDWALNEFGAA